MLNCSLRVVSVLILLVLGGFAARPAVSETAVKSAEPAKVSVSAKQKPVTEVFEDLAKSSGQKIVVESTVTGKVDLELNEVKLESALSAICAAVNCEWRKVHVAADSDLIDKADRFASTMRLMLGFGFPDVVLSKSSNNRVMVHLSDSSAVDAAEPEVTKQKGLVEVYLITNDAALASKVITPEPEPELEPKSEPEPAKTPAEEYAEKSKALMDDLMKMTPEEREEALMASLSLYEQMGPEYMAPLMQTVMRVGPAQMLFALPQDARREIMRLGVESFSSITREQISSMREDAVAVMRDMGINMRGAPRQ